MTGVRRPAISAVPGCTAPYVANSQGSGVRGKDPGRPPEPAAGQPGRLYVCGTPIGNLEDMTLRGLQVLRTVPLIAAEDTRRTRKLLSHFDIHTSLVSFNEHNQARRVPELLAHLQDGRDLALVSDAGMPTISDPGRRLVEAARQHCIPVSVVPGPSAVTAALACSGFPAEQFVFAGFLPRSVHQRRSLIASWRREPRTIAFFETPHRLAGALRDLDELLGDRALAVCRELTKVFEEVWKGTPRQALEHFASGKTQGELTLVLGPAAPAVAEEASQEELKGEIGKLLEDGWGAKEVSVRLAEKYGLSRRKVYRWVLERNRR